MKTSLKTVVSTALTALVLSASVFTSVAAENTKTLAGFESTQEIKKIVATGNVKVILIQSYNEQVALDEANFAKVSIKQVGYTLTIASNEKVPVTVTVYAYNPYRIDVSKNATVTTVGRFDVPSLQVLLKDNAVASIKTKTKSLYTVVNGHASLELKGSTANHIIKSDRLAILKTEGFAALQTDHVNSDTEIAMVVKPAKKNK